MKKYFLPLILASSALLFSCSNEPAGEKDEYAEPVPAPKAEIYLLNANLEKFIGNEGIPDFPFDEEFISANKIKEIISGERVILNKKPQDTLICAPLYVWSFDSTGMLLQKHIFENTPAPVHSEHYINQENFRNIANYKVNVDNDAVTVILKNGKFLFQETRTEAFNSDTTKYFYKSDFLDSVSIAYMSGKRLYTKFERFPAGAIKRRFIKESDQKIYTKDWKYSYDSTGRLSYINEFTEGNGKYSFGWDEKGRLHTSSYTLHGKLVYSKVMTYDKDGFLTQLTMELPEGKSIYDFVYRKK